MYLHRMRWRDGFPFDVRRRRQTYTQKIGTFPAAAAAAAFLGRFVIQAAVIARYKVLEKSE